MEMMEVLKMVKMTRQTRIAKYTGKRRASLELSLQRKPLGKAQAMFHRAIAAAKGDEGRWESSWRVHPDHLQRKDWCFAMKGTCGQGMSWKEREELMKAGRSFQKSWNVSEDF